ncbi:MAG TPA: hypothetical protein VMO00_10850 [Methylomirabilota bacterium]|nr:hypothetical protein [Methylomirabilota bacterium]
MASTRKWLLYLVCSSFGWGGFLTGCASAPRAVQIPTVLAPVRPAIGLTSDYPETLAAIVSVMTRELKLPTADGTVTFYPNSVALESALVVEYEKDFEQVEKQLGPKEKERFQATKAENIALAARQRATTAVAVGMHKRVLVNELVFVRYAWSERIRVLAHELTHTVERALVDGRLISADLWLVEGFAEWVAYKVVDALDIETFAKGRERNVDVVAQARQYQTFPSLTQLVTGTEWLTWARTLGREATYGQALLAVDFLIEQKSLPAVVEYFRLFGKVNNRERNFVTAFGEPAAKFEGEFSQHLQMLLGK